MGPCCSSSALFLRFLHSFHKRRTIKVKGMVIAKYSQMSFVTDTDPDESEPFELKKTMLNID